MENFAGDYAKGDPRMIGLIEQAISKIEAILWKFNLQKPLSTLYPKVRAKESRQSKDARFSVGMSSSFSLGQAQERNSCPATIKSGIMGEAGRASERPSRLNLSIPGTSEVATQGVRQTATESGLKRRLLYMQLA